MNSTLEGIVTEPKLVHPLNAKEPICLLPLPNVTDARLVHLANDSVSIDITLLGIVIVVKEVHSLNALQPMCFTLFGIVIY